MEKNEVFPILVKKEETEFIKMKKEENDNKDDVPHSGRKPKKEKEQKSKSGMKRKRKKMDEEEDIEEPPKKKTKFSSEETVKNFIKTKNISDFDLLNLGKLLYSQPYELENCESYNNLSIIAKKNLKNLKEYLLEKKKLFKNNKIKKGDWILFENKKVVKSSEKFNDLREFEPDYLSALFIKVGSEFLDNDKNPTEWNNFTNERIKEEIE
jgi:hypothetical protein